MAVTTGRVYVERPNPVFTPRYGLFDVVPPRDFPDLHAEIGGVNYQIASDVPGHGYDVTCAPGTAKTFDAGPTTVNADPFVVYASMTCGSAGMTEEMAYEWLGRRLESTEQAMVESIFSQGLNGQAPSLISTANTLTAATTMTAAVATLEGWLYQTQLYGRRGIIHVPAIGVNYLRQTNSIHQGEDGIWITPLGTRISMGAYAGNGAGASPGVAPAAGHTTLYITGEMGIWRDPQAQIFVAPYREIFNKPANQFLALAERNYIVSVDAKIAAVDVTLAP